ncbi:MAG TPA: preprotein translocase subunit YajC [Bacillota bacterium]|nr:preprotein translocase subunit YajC [Bacillota bacterium]
MKFDAATVMNVGSVLLLMLVFYFLLIRPQQKQAKAKQELLNSLRDKDKVVTIGGIYGTIMRVKDKTVMLKIAEKTEIEVLKSAIGHKQNEA